jgi:hypothetical protein
MAKKVKEVAVEQPANDVFEEKMSIKEILQMQGTEIYEDIAKVRVKLIEAQKFALKNKRPHRHFFAYSEQLNIFNERFARMLR